MSRLTRLVLLLLVLLSGCDNYDPDQTAAYLADLGITGYQLEPSFSSSTFDYVATIPPGTDSITVEVTSTHQGATVTVNGVLVDSDGGSITLQLAEGTNTIKVVVLSSDNMRTQTYTVLVTGQWLSYSVGGAVSGLTGALTLQNNAGDDLAIAADGAFEFATPVTDGDDYAVTVSVQPDGQFCSVTNAAGTIAGANVSDVAVTCVDLISGLFIDDLVVGLDYSCSSGTSGKTAANGQFTCPRDDDISFWLGSNELGPVRVGNLIITPLSLFPENALEALNLARLLQTLDSDGDPDNEVILLNDALVAALPANLQFWLAPAEFEQAVGITLVSMEVAQANLRDATAQYTPDNTPPIAEAGPDRLVVVGSTVTLNGGGSTDANGDGLTFTWTFVSRPAGSSAVLASKFTAGPSFVADVAGQYAIGVLVSDRIIISYDTLIVTANDGAGLPAAPQGLQAVAGDALVALSWSPVDGATGYMIYWNTTGNVTAASNWMGPIANTQANLGGLTNGTTYYYRVAARNASGEGPLSNEASATPESAVPTTFTVGGNVSGLTGTVTLQNNGVDSIAVTNNGSLPFFTDIADGTGYDITISAQPVGQNCTITNGSGIVSSADVINILVACVTDTFSVGGVVSGLTGTVNLQNNAADSASISVNGTFIFPSELVDGSAYSVSIAGQPAGQTCSVTSGSGVISGADVTGVNVDCIDNGGGDTSIWKWANPLPQGNPIVDMVWDGSKFIGVGSFGTILTSYNGLNWTRQVSGTGAMLMGIAWSGSQFVVIGSQTILTSPDGFTWTTQNPVPAPTAQFRDIAWGNGLFVAVGPLGSSGGTNSVFTSPDGVTWTPRDLATPTQERYLRGVAWNGSEFLIVDATTEAAGYSVHTSLDGVTWTAHLLGANYPMAVASDGNQFVVVANKEISTSLDGVNWSVHSTKFYLWAATWSGGQFIVAGGAGAATSTDGVTWTDHDFNVCPEGSCSYAQTVASNGDQIIVAAGSYILNSSDAVAWTLQTSGTVRNLNDIVRSDSQFVVVGYGVIQTSNDGAVWTRRDFWSNPYYMNSGDLNGVGWDGRLYVSVGQGGVILTSQDGITWDSRISGTTYHLVDVAGSGDGFVAVGDSGTILFSADGITWAPQTTPTSTSTYFTDIVWNGSQYVAVGNDRSNYAPQIITSPDGQVWTNQTHGIPRFNYLYSVIWQGSEFWAVGGSIYATSPDGMNWTTGSFPVGVRVIALSGSQLVAVGDEANPPYRNYVLTSSDGVTWTSQETISGGYSGIAADGGRLVVVGSGGRILFNDAL